MTDYFFSLEKSSNFAETDAIGGAICLYLPEFYNILGGNIYEYGSIADDVIISVLIAVLVHEDIHVEICKELDTENDQEHSTVYKWIQKALS